MIKNKEIWKAFHSILFSYTDVVNNPYCNYEGNDEDEDKNDEKDGCLFSIFKCFR